jgi:hypothetical protein
MGETVENGRLRKITGGSADRYENKGVVKMAIQMLMKTRELKIDRWRDDETGTLSVEP